MRTRRLIHTCRCPHVSLCTLLVGRYCTVILHVGFPYEELLPDQLSVRSFCCGNVSDFDQMCLTDTRVVWLLYTSRCCALRAGWTQLSPTQSDVCCVCVCRCLCVPVRVCGPCLSVLVCEDVCPCVSMVCVYVCVLAPVCRLTIVTSEYSSSSSSCWSLSSKETKNFLLSMKI